MPCSFSTSFVYDFKRGDNIVLNCQSIHKLWSLREELPAREQWLLNKPIVLMSAAVVEVCLCELFQRVRFHTLEGVPRLTAKQIKGIKITKKDDFGLYLAQCKQNKILGPTRSFDNVYSRLDNLRKTRNRIHIQNLDGSEPRCDRKAFSDEIVTEAEWLLEFTLKYLSTHYPRRRVYTENARLPWNHGIEV
ncbi:hypothetical protein [Ascidiaceihabitans sp.]|uniref:hypothetical protein n=1 Tax=Ascidiaceihabitans sp. TaxID=1872644 RepID=UPI003298B0DD